MLESPISTNHVNSMPVYKQSLSNRWKELRRTMTGSVVVETPSMLSICHGYHKEASNFIGVIKAKSDLGHKTSKTLLSHLSLGSICLYATPLQLAEATSR